MKKIIPAITFLIPLLFSTPLLATPQDDLFAAAKLGYVTGGKKALKAGADIESKNSEGNTVLVFAAMHGKTEFVKMLIENSANVNFKNQNGGTPLIGAAYSGNAAIVKLLISSGADLNVKTTAGYSALDFANMSKSSDKLEIIEVLKNSGIKNK